MPAIPALGVAICALISLPAVFVPAAGSISSAWVLLAVFNLLSTSLFTIGTSTIVHLSSGAAIGKITAVHFAWVGITGTAIAPTLVAVFAEHLFQGSLGSALSAVGGVLAALGGVCLLIVYWQLRPSDTVSSLATESAWGSYFRSGSHKTHCREVEMQVIRFEQKDSIGHIVLANPPKNLIASDFSNALKQVVHEASESDIRALLVRAEGPNFSQGGDVLDFLEKNTNQFRTFIAECNQSFRAIEALQIPTVAAVRGAAFGGAFELALACDFIVAAEDAVFRCIEASVGSAPVAGAVQRLAERIGRSRAARYAMLCEPMSGVTAGQLGIATLVVSADEVEAAALKFAQDLSTGPTRSYAAIRTLLKAWSGGGVPSADAMILDVTMALHSSEDARRGRTARAEAIRKGIEPPNIVFSGR